jgi:nucleoside-diphosphate-sugar epimerase
MKHTILGAGGSIGNCLAHQLLKTNERIRMVSRSNYSMLGAESFAADLTSYDKTLQSIEGSDIVYLVAGLPYDLRIWEEQWPKIMRNVIDACIKTNSRLVFFDNVYMYGKVDGKMVETTSYNPVSKKGEVRANIAAMLESKIALGDINAIIARSADIYGPYALRNSIFHILVIDRFLNGKRANWLIDDKLFHSFTYTLDAARGMILLAKSDECYNQIWHLPTTNPLSPEILIKMVANELGIDPDYDVLNRWQLRLAGFFDKIVSESYEMLYQHEYKYYFDSTKFNTYFDYRPKSYFDGIQETIKFIGASKSQLNITLPVSSEF